MKIEHGPSLMDSGRVLSVGLAAPTTGDGKADALGTDDSR